MKACPRGSSPSPPGTCRASPGRGSVCLSKKRRRSQCNATGLARWRQPARAGVTSGRGVARRGSPLSHLRACLQLCPAHPPMPLSSNARPYEETVAQLFSPILSHVTSRNPGSLVPLSPCQDPIRRGSQRPRPPKMYREACPSCSSRRAALSMSLPFSGLRTPARTVRQRPRRFCRGFAGRRSDTAPASRAVADHVRCHHQS